MIGHEDPGMHVHPELIRPLAQPVGIRFHIGISREANLAVVTPLHNMHRQTGRTQAAAAWHERLPTDNRPASPQQAPKNEPPLPPDQQVFTLTLLIMTLLITTKIAQSAGWFLVYTGNAG